MHLRSPPFLHGGRNGGPVERKGRSSRKKGEEGGSCRNTPSSVHLYRFSARTRPPCTKCTPYVWTLCFSWYAREREREKGRLIKGRQRLMYRFVRSCNASNFSSFYFFNETRTTRRWSSIGTEKWRGVETRDGLMLLWQNDDSRV